MATGIFEQIYSSGKIHLSLENIPKGIDNLRVDVSLSNKFCADLKFLIAELRRRETEGLSVDADTDRVFNSIEKSYADMMNVHIHRIKTSLNQSEIFFLQFAVLKHILDSVNQELTQFLDKLAESLSSLHSRGSMESVTLHNRQSWLRKNRNHIIYQINRQIFDRLLDAEKQHIAPVRLQLLNSDYPAFSEFLSCAVLMHPKPNAATFLLENYVFWGYESKKSGFTTINKATEDLLSTAIPELKPDKLNNENASRHDSSDSFFHQDLEPYLGQQDHPGDELTEVFCWLDSPETVASLFDIKTLKQSKTRDRNATKILEKFLKDFFKILKKHNQYNPIVAMFELPHIWSYGICEDIDPVLLCQYLAGEIKFGSLENPVLGGRKLGDDEKRILKNSLRDVARSLKKQRQENILKIIVALSRFRRDLKYARFAHFIFNRMNMLNDHWDMQLSSQAATLYQLPCRHEVEYINAKVVHHTILKADVRGSTRVTADLESRELNPASHFSLHFFNPIQEILPQYAAAKVFLEGDAVILGLLEHDTSPDNWLTVARACGLAKAILKIIEKNNALAQSKGLPTLELGIGICYSDDSPRYLFDSGKPVMISSAIGQADRLSSCSRQLREHQQKLDFNVEVVALADDQQALAEKTQDTLQYNVNGILLQEQAFAKLNTELTLHKLRLEVAGRSEVFLCGVYPDAENNYQDLVIREGRVGLWQNNSIIPGNSGSTAYHEVITDDDILNRLSRALEQANM